MMASYRIYVQPTNTTHPSHTDVVVISSDKTLAELQDELDAPNNDWIQLTVPQSEGPDATALIRTNKVWRIETAD
jgi:hypothetical protein